MKSNTRVLFAVTVLALAALACNAISGGGNDTPPVDVNPPSIEPTDEPLIDLPPILGGDVLLRDDFSGGDSNWGIGTDADSSVEYVGDALNFIVTKDFYFVWSTPNDERYQNVHIEATAANNSIDENAGFGIICNMQVTDTSYYLVVTGAGAYAIGKSAVALDDVILTNDNSWETSDLITPGASSYRIGADCGNGVLTLYVDGQQIDSVTDSDYADGYVALMAWSDERISGTNVTFDDFVLTSLP